MRRSRRLAPAPLVLAALSCAACGPNANESNSLEREANVRIWATSASALAVYSHAHGPIAFADGEGGYPDAACPETSDDGTTVRIAGGCTDNRGTEWIGSATITRSADGGRSLSFDGFGSFDVPEWRASLTGSVELRRVDATTHAFEADFVQEGGMIITFRYSGRVIGGYGEPTRWSGSGEIERVGLARPTGKVRATTEDELVDDAVCSGQPVSGVTTLETADEIAVVRYDGATDCDAEQSAEFSVNGEERGRISGIHCAFAAPSTTDRAVGGVGLFGLAALALSLRRRAGAKRRAAGLTAPRRGPCCCTRRAGSPAAWPSPRS